MSNEAKTPNGASKEYQIVETEEDVCPDMVVLATAFDINDVKNRVETNRKESRIADSNMLKYLLENFQEIKLRGRDNTPKVKSAKINAKKVSSKEKKEDKEKLDEDKVKKVRKTTTSTERKPKVTKAPIKKHPTDGHTDGR